MDAKDFTKEIRGNYQLLWYVAFGCCNDRSLADDIVQDAVLSAFQKRAEFRMGTSFTAWLSRYIKNISQNYRRKSTRRKTLPTDPTEMDRWVRGPTANQKSDFFSTENFDDSVAEALSRLVPVERTCLLMKVVGNCSYREISVSMEIPEGTAMSHVSRAKKKIRSQLSDVTLNRGSCS